PAQAGVDHELDVVAQSLPGGANVGNIALLALAHRPPAELDGLVALACELAGDAFGLGRSVAEQDRSIGPERFLEASPQELVDRLAGGLADDVPEGDFDAAHGLDGRPLPTKENRALVHQMNEPIDLEGVLAQNALSQAAANLVRQGRLDDRLGHQGGRIDLTDAADAGIGVHLDDQRFLAAVAALVDLGQTQVNGFDVGDLHGGISYGIFNSSWI